MNRTSILLTAFFIIFIDQLTKFIAFNSNNYFINTGIFAGLFQSQFEIVIILSLIGVFISLAFYISSQDKLIKFLLWLIFVAGISNFISRLFYGGVLDFIEIGKFPTFNFADAIISLAVIVLIIYLIIHEVNRIKSDRRNK